ncbi:MAG: hypothetical protein ACLP01_28985 [Solirubrobacteraceae bacterium]
MSTNRFSRSRRHSIVVGRSLVLVRLAGAMLAAALPAGAVAATVADQARNVAKPAAGTWKLTPVSKPSELASASFTLKGSTIEKLHGTMNAISACAGGKFTVSGQFTIKEVMFVGGVTQWTVGVGRNTSGGLAARPVTLEIDGHKQVDATLSIAFPGSGQKGAGELNWGIESTPGISPCTTEYYVTHG